MKLRDKHYFEIGLLPVILLPVIALTIGLTLWASGPRHESYPEPTYSRNWNLPPAHEDAKNLYDDATNDDLEENDSAVFTFTGDTVLILSLPDQIKGTPDFYKVLYKNLQGSLQTIDLPEAELKKIGADTTEVSNQ